MDEADIAADQHFGPVRTVRAQRIGHALEIAPLDRFSVEAQDAGDAAHREATKPYLPLRRIGAGFSRSSSSAYADDPVITERPICHGGASTFRAGITGCPA